MEDDLFTTKVTIEVTISHFGTVLPKQAIEVIVIERVKCPAVKDITVVGAKSNYQVHSKPLADLVDVKL